MSNDLERAPEYRGNLAEEKLPTEVSLDELRQESQRRWEQQGGTIPNVGDQTAATGITGVPKRPQDCQSSQAQPDGELPERQGYDQPPRSVSPRSVANPGGPPRKAQP